MRSGAENMIVCKLIRFDIRQGVFYNKRFLAVPVLALVQCIMVICQRQPFMEYYNVKCDPSFGDMLVMIFEGCCPIVKCALRNITVSIPYYWLIIFITSVFISFDYMYLDLTRFGMQILTRTNRRADWWFSKCVSGIASGIWFGVLFYASVLLFCIVMKYPLTLHLQKDVLEPVVSGNVLYHYAHFPKMTAARFVMLFLAPVAVFCTLNLLQMFFTLFCKPMYSFLIILGILVLSVMFDGPVFFPRSAMLLNHRAFYSDGYPYQSGMLIEAVVIAAVILVGAVLFHRHNILPDKE